MLRDVGGDDLVSSFLTLASSSLMRDCRSWVLVLTLTSS